MVKDDPYLITKVYCQEQYQQIKLVLRDLLVAFLQNDIMQFLPNTWDYDQVE